MLSSRLDQATVEPRSTESQIMRALSFSFTAAGQMAWVVDQNCKLVGGSNSTGNLLVTTDPTLTLADLTAAPANIMRTTVLLFLALATSTRPVIALPLIKGQTIYLTSSTFQTCVLYLA